MGVKNFVKNRIPDKIFLKFQYRKIFGKNLDLKNPRTFNEKLQWLKLYDRRPEYTTMVDKYKVKEYVADIIGDKYIIPTLGVWNSFNEINFDELPCQFVLKCTHDSGGIVICKDKNEFDKIAAKRIIEKSLSQNWYWVGREWPYKNVQPRIIAEQYLTDESNEQLKDYKIFNFDGEPKLIEVDYDRFIEHKRNLYSTSWNYIDATIQFPTDPEHEIRKPSRLEEMLELAKKLSAGIPHLRTDFYIVKDSVYFGELTFSHGSGFEQFLPKAFEDEFSSWLKLPVV